MNCHNHPQREATAICTECGQALCNECVSSKSGLCKSCYDTILSGKIIVAVSYLVILAVIGVIGYLWDPMGKDGMSESGNSCYMLMAICTGLFLISGRIQLPAITFLAAGANNVGFVMLFAMLVKFIIAVVLGSLLLPFVIIWQLFVIVFNIIKIKNNKRKSMSYRCCSDMSSQVNR